MSTALHELHIRLQTANVSFQLTHAPLPSCHLPTFPNKSLRNCGACGPFLLSSLPAAKAAANALSDAPGRSARRPAALCAVYYPPTLIYGYRAPFLDFSLNHHYHHHYTIIIIIIIRTHIMSSSSSASSESEG